MAFKKGESGNPAGRPPRAGLRDPSESSWLSNALSRVRARMDGWTNMLTALGTGGDKRSHSFFSPDIVSDTEAMNLWRGDDICKRIIENGPKTEFRRNFILKIQDKELAEECMAQLEDLGVVNKFVQARCYENAYGGAALFPVTDDVASLTEPLDEDNINRIDAIHLFEPRELTPVTYFNDIHDKRFGEPEIWRLVPMNGARIGAQMVYIHTSRLIIFKGRCFSKQLQAGQRPGWGDSKLTGVYPIVRDFGSSWGYVAALLADFSQGVLRMDGYADLMATEGGEEIVKARLRMMDYVRSSLRSLVMDKNDEFSRQTTPLSGASEILHDMAIRIAAAAEQPVTVLFGMAPAGLNATGDNDVRGWYDNVSSDREHQTKPKLEHFIRIFLKTKEAPTQGKEPDVWSVEFPPLWEPTEQERAQTRYTIAQTDQIYWNMGAATTMDIAESRWKGDTFSPEMVIDWGRLEKQQKAEDDMAAAQREAALNPPDPTLPPPDGSTPPPPDGSSPPTDPSAPPSAPADDTSNEDAGGKRSAKAA